jgi:hypothetical protein
VALDAPDMPVGQLALRLDEAETAYQPPRVAVAPGVVILTATPAALAASTIADSKPPLLQAAVLDGSSATFGRPVIEPARKRGPKQTQSTAASKRKPKPLLVAKVRGPARLALLETPGALMYRAYSNRQS